MTAGLRQLSHLLSLPSFSGGFQPPGPALRPSNGAITFPTQSLVQVILPSGVLPSLK